MKNILFIVFVFNFFTSVCAGTVSINNETLKDLGENFDLEACVKNHEAKITILRIEGMPLNRFPQFIFSLKYLKELYLIDCHLQGPIPALIGKLNNLEVLDLSRNQLSEGVPVNIQKLQKLKKLVLSHNKFSSLYNLVYLDCLTHLDVQHNKHLLLFHGSAFRELPKSLLVLKANDCSFKSHLPSLTSCRNLEFIDFSNNQMKGTIPSAWMDFHNLKEIILINNCLNGSLPQKIWELYQLEKLSIEDNRDLRVVISPDIQYLDELRLLFTYGCRLEGKLPPELKKTKLSTLTFGPVGDFSESIHALPSSLQLLFCGLSQNSFDSAHFPGLRCIDGNFVMQVRNAENHEFEAMLPVSDNFKQILKGFFRFQSGIASITIYLLNNGVQEGTINCFYDEQGCRQITLSYVQKESASIPLDHLLESAATPDSLFAREMPDELIACSWQLPEWAQELEPILAEIGEAFVREHLGPVGGKRLDDSSHREVPDAKRVKF